MVMTATELVKASPAESAWSEIALPTQMMMSN
jgi:hypothetical protein